MKKLIILLIIILGISLIAYAGATKIDLINQRGAYTGTESGWVIVNTNSQKTILNFQIDGLPVNSGQEYWAYYYESGVVMLGQLKLNKSGSGHLNAHVQGGISSFWVGVGNTANVIDDSDVVLNVYVP